MEQNNFQNSSLEVPQSKNKLWLILGIGAILLVLLFGILGFFLFPFQSTQENIPIPLNAIDGEVGKVITLKNPRYANGDLDAIFDEEDLNEEVLDFQLKSHPNVNHVKQVGAGNQVVMWYDVHSVYQLENALGDPEFIDMKTGELVDREWRYVIWVNETREREVCSSTGFTQNGTETCLEYTTENYEVETWLPYNSRDLPKGTQRIGIEVEVKLNDHIDGVWVVGGKKIDRHAQWEASLENGLLAWYDFNETSGTNVINRVGGTSQNGTIVGSITQGVSGIKGNAYNFTDGSINLTGLTSTVQNYSFSFWAEPDSNSTNQYQFVFDTETGRFAIQFTNTANSLSFQDGSQKTFSIVPTTELSHYIFTFSGTNASLYINGTYRASAVYSPKDISGRTVISGTMDVFSSLRYFGILDEYAIWNRSLTESEITTLYNDGNGCTYQECTEIEELNIDLISPANNTNFTTDNINFSANVTSTDSSILTIANVSLLINGTIVETNTSGFEGNYTFQRTIADGQHNYTFIAFGNDSIQYNATNGTLLFTIDLVEPTVTLYDPANATESNRETWYLISNLTHGNYTLNNATLNVWFSNGTLFNQTTNTSIAGTSDIDVNYTLTNVPFGETYLWNVLLNYENPTLGTSNSTEAAQNFTFTRLPFEVTGESFNPTALETDSETFFINFTTISEILSTSINFNYDGKQYFTETNCVNGLCILNRKIDIPLVTTGNFQNKTFFWELKLFNGIQSFSFNTSENQQNVSRIFFESNNTNATIKTANFTAWDEQNLTRLDPFRFDGTFNFWLGSGTIARNSSFNDSSVSNRTIFISHNRIFRVNATINYNNATGDSYNTRNYYFQNDSFTNSSQDFRLYLLNKSHSTSFIIKVQDISLFPVTDVLVKTQRYYPGTNEFRTVQIVKTDQSGEGIGFYETEVVEYVHTITRNQDVLLATEKQKIFPKESPFTLTFTIGKEAEDPFEFFEEDPNKQTTLSFNRTTKIVTFSYIDSTGKTTLGKLIVKQEFPRNQTITVCTNTLALSAGTITCNLSNLTDGNFIAEGYIDDGSTIAKIVRFVIEKVSDIIEKHGLILAWFIIITAGLAGIWNPTVSIILVNAAVIFVNIIGLVAFSPIWIFSMIAISITLVVIMKT